MIIVSVTGGIGHGKTTFADFLAQCGRKHQHWESSDIIIEVANALRSKNVDNPNPENIIEINKWLQKLPLIIEKQTHQIAQWEQIKLSERKVKANPQNYEKLFDYLKKLQKNPKLLTVPITHANKSEFRELLQWIGGYLVQSIEPTIWFSEILRRISAKPPLDIATIGGLRYPEEAELVKKAGGIIVQIKRPDVSEQDIGDITEREREYIVPDAIIVNDGTIEQLHNCASALYKDLMATNPITGNIYKASTISS